MHALDGVGDVHAVTEGTGALVHGPIDATALDSLLTVPGVGGAERLSDDVWMVWTEAGRSFDEAPIPLLGQHGSPRCRTQMAIVSGGDPRAAPLAERIVTKRPSALDWAPTVADLLGIGEP